MPKRLIIIDWEQALYANNALLFPCATQKLLKRIHKQQDTQLVIVSNSKSTLIKDTLIKLFPQNKTFISDIAIYDSADLHKKGLTTVNLAVHLCQKEAIVPSNAAIVDGSLTVLDKAKLAGSWPILVPNKNEKSNKPGSANYLNCLPRLFDLGHAAKNELHARYSIQGSEKKSEQVRLLYDQFVADLSYQRGIKWLSNYQMTPSPPVYYRSKMALITAWNLYAMVGNNGGVLYSQLALATLYERGKQSEEWLRSMTRMANFYISMDEKERASLSHKQAFYALFSKGLHYANNNEPKDALHKAVMLAVRALKAPLPKYPGTDFFYAVANTPASVVEIVSARNTSSKLSNNAESSPEQSVKSAIPRSTSLSSS